jgi:hypothetical protein
MTKAETVELLPCPFCRHNLVVSGEIARCATLGCWVSSRNVLVPLDVPRQVAEWNTRSDATCIAALEAENAALFKQANDMSWQVDQSGQMMEKLEAEAARWREVAGEMAGPAWAMLTEWDLSNPMRTADVHGSGCKCSRCKRDQMEAALARYKQESGQ